MNPNSPSQNRSTFEDLFLSPDERRLRAGWRLLLFAGFLLVISGCLGLVLVLFLVILNPALLDFSKGISPEVLLLSVIGEAIGITLAVFLARRFLDKRSIESLGLKLNSLTLLDLLAGVGITFLQMGLIYLLMSALGWVKFQGFAWQFDPLGLVLKNGLLFLITFVLVAWSEELLDRGYILQTIASGLNLLWGVILSSVIFGVLHIFNPGANLASILGIFLAGLFFAYGYIRTKQLWLPIGMHLGWNFFEGVVFGFPVSGLTIYPLLRIQVLGPVVWTGGEFGPEAGLIVIPALLLGTFLIYLFTRKRVENGLGLES